MIVARLALALHMRHPPEVDVATDWIDADDFGAELRKRHPGKRRRDERGEFDDAQTREWSAGHCAKNLLRRAREALGIAVFFHAVTVRPAPVQASTSSLLKPRSPLRTLPVCAPRPGTARRGSVFNPGIRNGTFGTL